MLSPDKAGRLIAARTCLKHADHRADPRHLGARIGITAVLHSWGLALKHHPHIHMILPGGGISLDRPALGLVAAGILLPVRVLGNCSAGCS